MEGNIEGLGKGRVIIQQDFDNLETELQETRAQVAKLQRKQLGQNNKTALARFRINYLEQIIKKIQARHQADKESLLGSEGAVGLIHWFARTESVFSRSNCTEDYKKYYPQTEVQKMEDEFYHLTVKGNDLKTYVRSFQELATLCPTMVSDSEKMMEAFIGRLPQSIEVNVTASKP
nr:reverse transcriptase domain-containing protein [Tanacetum cinerariifolium]